MYELSVEGVFSAAHQVNGYAGDCAGIHGHTYRIEVKVRIKKLDKIGMSMDFRIIKKVLSMIINRLDHKNLNTLPYFKKYNATAEYIARYLYQEMRKKIKSVYSISVWEGPNNKITYYEEV